MVGDVKTLLDSFEMITLHMCAKNILPFAGTYDDCPSVR